MTHEAHQVRSTGILGQGSGVHVPLTVIILAKNEAGRIGDCLKSVLWAAELLVIDDESTDETVTIAESLGARVLRRKMDIEGRHRNWAHAQAQHEWVLSLDADERVTPELAQEIQRVLSNKTAFDVYAIPRRNFIGERWIRYGGWYPSAQVKLFKRSVFRWEETTVHPRAFADRPSGTLQHDLLHYSYRDLADFVSKLNRQTTLEAQKWLADGRRLSLTKALWRTMDRFYRSYVGKQGYRDGLVGYVVSVMAAAYQIISYAKYWEQSQVRVPDLPAMRPLDRSHPRAASEAPQGRLARPRLSCVVITKNETKRIPALLESIAWADEIVVVDDESDDGTPTLCEAYRAKVITHRSDGDFDQQRNLGIDHASGEWILQLDADEVVSVELRRDIEQHLQDPGRCVAFHLVRRNHFLGRQMRYGGWAGQQLVKLFRKDAARYVGHSVYETLHVDGAIGRLQQPIDHYPFVSVEQVIARQNFYTTVEARVMRAKRGHIPLTELRRQLVRRPLKIFWKIYVKKWGWRDGTHGFVFAVLFAWVECLKWAKCGEEFWTQPLQGASVDQGGTAPALCA